MKITDDFCYAKEACHVYHQISAFHRQQNEKRTLVSPWRMHAVCQKAPPRLNSDKIKPVALAVIELHLSEGISQASYSVSQ